MSRALLQLVGSSHSQQHGTFMANTPRRVGGSCSRRWCCNRRTSAASKFAFLNSGQLTVFGSSLPHICNESAVCMKQQGRAKGATQWGRGV